MPRKIIGAAFLSLDGVMQAPGGPEEDTQGGFAYGGWMAALFEEALGHQVDTLFTPPFDLLLGRRTYDIFAAHWPFLLDDPIGQMFAKIDKFVLTRSEVPLEWQGSRRLPDMDALAALKAEDGPNLVIQGSSTIYPELMQRGLLDRLVLMVTPITLGTGKRLFGEGTPAGAFKLVEHRISAGGILMSTYEPAGPVQTATFELPEPAPEELARRAKMEAGTW
jgi:dihydrofolate reductase